MSDVEHPVRWRSGGHILLFMAGTVAGAYLGGFLAWKLTAILARYDIVPLHEAKSLLKSLLQNSRVAREYSAQGAGE